MSIAGHLIMSLCEWSWLPVTVKISSCSVEEQETSKNSYCGTDPDKNIFIQPTALMFLFLLY